MTNVEGNLFMMCKNVNREAFSPIPPGYSVRSCRKDELSIWKSFPFDNDVLAKEYENYMTDYFNQVYASKGDLFFKRRKFVVEKNTDKPVATCFAWKAYNSITTIHWFKTLKEYENKGIGRGLLSIVMEELTQSDYPVYLHTQPDSFRAIKLYTDFGFCLLDNKQVGTRTNNLITALPYLKEKMPADAYTNIKIATAPKEFLQMVDSSEIEEF